MFPWQAALIHTHSCPKGRVLEVASDHSKPISEPFQNSLHTREQGLWDFRHSLPPPTTIFSFKWAAQPCIKAEFMTWQSCHPVAGPDDHRPRGQVGTGNALHIHDTHSSWHMRAIGWSSLPGWGHFGTSVSPNYRISASHFLHPSSALLLLPLAESPMAESLNLGWEIDILTFLAPPLELLNQEIPGGDSGKQHFKQLYQSVRLKRQMWKPPSKCCKVFVADPPKLSPARDDHPSPSTVTLDQNFP